MGELSQNPLLDLAWLCVPSQLSQFPVCSLFFLGGINRFLVQTYPNTYQQISHAQKSLLALSLSWQCHWQDHVLHPSLSLGHLICDICPQSSPEQQNSCVVPKQWRAGNEEISGAKGKAATKPADSSIWLSSSSSNIKILSNLISEQHHWSQ